MPVRLHHLACSRGLRALGMLAWLMLVLGSLTAMPTSMAQPRHGAAHAMQAMAAESATHTQAPHATDAGAVTCDPQQHGGHASTGHVCGCAGLCVSALPAAPSGLPGLAPTALAYARPGRVQAPAPATVPPLRPPLA